LKELAAPVTGGDPMSEALYVRRSLQHLSDELADLGHAACPTTVAELLQEFGYRLRVNHKRLTGPSHPDRDTQFHYLGSLVDLFREEGWPILSIDTKKKELVGNFTNPGVAWLQQPYETNAHDFLRMPNTVQLPMDCTTCWRIRGTSLSASRPTHRSLLPRPWHAGGHGSAATVTARREDCCFWPTAAAAMVAGRACGRKACRSCWPTVTAW